MTKLLPVLVTFVIVLATSSALAQTDSEEGNEIGVVCTGDEKACAEDLGKALVEMLGNDAQTGPVVVTVSVREEVCIPLEKAEVVATLVRHGDERNKDVTVNPGEQCGEKKDEKASVAVTITKDAAKRVSAGCYRLTLAPKGEDKATPHFQTLYFATANGGFTCDPTSGEKKDEPAKPDTPKDEEKDDAEKLLAIDVQPLAATADQIRDHIVTKANKHVKYIYIDETLAVRPESDRYVTDTDTIVLRFIARKAVACRYTASPRDGMEWVKPVGVVGGKALLVPINAEDVAKVTAVEAPTSCGCRLVKAEAETGIHVVDTADAGCTTYIHVDVALGPYTNSNVALDVRRADRAFRGSDLKATVNVPNHTRYRAWYSVGVLATLDLRPGESVAVVPLAGSDASVIQSSTRPWDTDLTLGFRYYLYCTGEGNSFGEPVDLLEGSLCFSVSTAFSVADFLSRFYPFGLGIGMGPYLNLDLFVSLHRTEVLASGYASGVPFSGSADQVPSVANLSPGFAVGIGIDPSVFAEIVKAIVGVKK